MDFDLSPRAQDKLIQLKAFMDEHVYPNEETYHAQQVAMTDRWQPVPIVEELKPIARAAGLWNLFLPESDRGSGLTNLEYAPLAEQMGRVQWSSEVFNCSAPDTGNMETIERYGTEEHKQRWLQPLLAGEIRSCFCMTEPDVASSDATNIESTIRRDGDDYVLDGRKWWSSGSGDPRCKLFIFMGKSDPDNPDKHRQQSMILVPAAPRASPSSACSPCSASTTRRTATARSASRTSASPPATSCSARGAASRLPRAAWGPGRIHHCMRAVGLAERALELMCKRLLSRTAFGKPIADQGVMIERVANSRIEIDQVRLLVLHAAWKMDTVGNKQSRREIAAIKVAAAKMACDVVDRAIQAHGGGGVTEDFPLAHMYKTARTLRLVDGPDEVHRHQIGRLELAQYKMATNRA